MALKKHPGPILCLFFLIGLCYNEFIGGDCGANTVFR